MNPEWTHYRVGDLVSVVMNDVLGVVTKSNYWMADEYLGGNVECVDVMFGVHEFEQYPVEYLVKMK